MYNADTVLRTRVFEYRETFSKWQNGDGEHSGCPGTSKTDENIEIVIWRGILR